MRRIIIGTSTGTGPGPGSGTGTGTVSRRWEACSIVGTFKGPRLYLRLSFKAFSCILVAEEGRTF